MRLRLYVHLNDLAASMQAGFCFENSKDFNCFVHYHALSLSVPRVAIIMDSKKAVTVVMGSDIVGSDFGELLFSRTAKLIATNGRWRVIVLLDRYRSTSSYHPLIHISWCQTYQTPSPTHPLLHPSWAAHHHPPTPERHTASNSN